MTPYFLLQGASTIKETLPRCLYIYMEGVEEGQVESGPRCHLSTWHMPTRFSPQMRREWRINLGGKIVEMENAKKNSINISKIHCLTFSNWNPMRLIYFGVYFITSCPNFFLVVICLSTSPCTPLPHSPVVYFTWPRLFVPVSQLSCRQ